MGHRLGKMSRMTLVSWAVGSAVDIDAILSDCIQHTNVRGSPLFSGACCVPTLCLSCSQNQFRKGTNAVARSISHAITWFQFALLQAGR